MVALTSCRSSKGKLEQAPLDRVVPALILHPYVQPPPVQSVCKFMLPHCGNWRTSAPVKIASLAKIPAFRTHVALVLRQTGIAYIGNRALTLQQ